MAGSRFAFDDHPGIAGAPSAGRTLREGLLEATRSLRVMDDEAHPVPTEQWDVWLRAHFPLSVDKPFGERHRRLWAWIEALRAGEKPRARVEIWPRGGSKSSSAEMGVARVGMRQARRFALYVSATQGQANKHVQAIAAKFERLGVPRAVNSYGNSLGWRVDLLRVANSFSVLALGLDAAARGVKIEDDRPDLIVLDDIDDRHDSQRMTRKKAETITDSVLPGGSRDCAVLFVQNRIHEGSIASQLADGTAEFLLAREVYEEPAVRGLEYQPECQEDGTRLYRITAGEPTWEGQNLETCEAQFNEWGRAAFLREAQHDVQAGEDGLWQRDRDIDPFRRTTKELPEMVRVGVAVDPNASTGNDEAGIVAGGVAKVEGVWHGWLLEDATIDGGPAAWARESVACYKRWGADVLVAEANNGGDMVGITIGTVDEAPVVKLIHASRGKKTRAEPVQKLCEDGRIHHVGVFLDLERELCTWRPGDPSPNRLDAYVWLFTELMLMKRRKSRVWYPGMPEPEEAEPKEGAA